MSVTPFPVSAVRDVGETEPSARPKQLARPWFAELAALTNFSFLNGGSHPDEMVAQAKALGLDAIAVADINTLAGVVRAHTAAKQADLRLLVGARLVVPGLPVLVCLPTDRDAYGRLSRLL
ncbi:MAG: PHP domain-containing protein, partial [Pseudomonadota bacterium]